MEFIEYIRKRIEHNKNFLAVITGQTGSGKSYSALRLGEVLDPSFSIDRVAFNPLEFMRIINNGGLKKGSVIVFDEAGVGMSSREWQQVHNKLINFVMQTFRHKNYIVIFTTPHFGFIDAGSRKLFHAHLETVGINRREKYCKLKPLLTQVNQRQGKIYYKYLRVRGDGGLRKIARLLVGLPSDELVAAYEARKTAYTSALNEEILDALEARASSVKPLSVKQQEVYDYLREGLCVDAVAEVMRIQSRVVYQHLSAMEKKGYTVTPVKDGAQVLSYEVTP